MPKLSVCESVMGPKLAVAAADPDAATELITNVCTAAAPTVNEAAPVALELLASVATRELLPAS